MPSPIVNDLRIRILAAFQRGQTSTVQLARRFSVSQPSVWRLLRRFKDENTIQPKGHGGGQPAMLSREDLLVVKNLVDVQPELTAEDIASKLSKRIGKRPSNSVIWRALKKIGYTRKKSVVRDQAKKRPDVIRRRRKWLKVAKNIDPKRLVFLDETGINGGFRPSTGWAPRGSSPVVCRPTISRTNHTVVGAVRASGLVAMQSMRGGMRKGNFFHFIKSALGPRLRRGDILVLDNLASHRNKQVVDFIRSFGADVAFLPPYSPELNPIEMAWSTLKYRFARRFRASVQRIRRAIGGAWRSLRNLDFIRFLPACGYQGPIQLTG